MIGSILTGVVAAIHVYILVLEMFLWDKPQGRKAFGTTEAFARESKTLAANQGLYNGFLAAGLIWALIAPSGIAAPLAIFFLGCVLVAGVYGELTANKRILVIQAVPAFVAIIAVVMT